MHKEILTEEQIKLLPFLAGFSEDFGLVGGTAIAFQIGHRRSIDFDLFTNNPFGNRSLSNELLKHGKIEKVIVDRLDELTLVTNGVKITFLHYPYKVRFSESFGYSIKMPDLLTLGAMKAFALGRRAKWKDFVDLFFIMKDYFSVTQISQKGEQIFGTEFNEKLFRIQLAYFDGIDYGEKVEFLPGFEVEDEEIKKKLIDFSLKQ